MFLREDTLPNMQRRIEYEMKCTEVPHFIIKTRTVRTEAGTERHCSSLQDTHSSIAKGEILHNVFLRTRFSNWSIF